MTLTRLVWFLNPIHHHSISSSHFISFFTITKEHTYQINCTHANDLAHLHTVSARKTPRYSHGKDPESHRKSMNHETRRTGSGPMVCEMGRGAVAVAAAADDDDDDDKVD